MRVTEIGDQRGAKKAESETKQFLDRCTSCGACSNVCTLLSTSGAPDTVISRGDQNVFLCTNCGACNSVCPSGLNPSDALLWTKHRLLMAGQVSDRISKSVCAARRYAGWGRSFPFTYYSSAETVFWPGCSLTGMSPEVVLKTQQLLAGKLGKKVGIALDCCFDPAYQIGDLDTVHDASQHIKRMLEQKGITSVIAACTNCIKVFSKYLRGVRVDHVLNILPDPAVPSLGGEECYLHHPCPTYRFKAVQGRAKRLLTALGARVVEQTRPRCCGFGGNMHEISPELADSCTRDVMAAAGNASIVTYCMACKDRFLSEESRVYHILELLVGAPPANRPISSEGKWFNRFLLMRRARRLDAGNR